MKKHLLPNLIRFRTAHWLLPIVLLLFSSILSSFINDKDNPKQTTSAPPSLSKSTVRPFDADPIKFTLQADKRTASVGEEVTLTITAHYLNIPSTLLFTAAGSTAFRLKVLLPDGFVQTGGDYVDYIGTELSPVKPTAVYTLKGYFSKSGNKIEFRLLRSHGHADATSLFVEKARISIQAAVLDFSNTQSQKSAREGSCSYSEGQYLFTTSWGEVIYAHYYNGILFAALQSGDGFKPQSWLVATGQMTSSVASCFAANDPHTSTPPPPPTGNCNYTEGQYLFTFNSEQMYAHFYNGVLFAAYQDGSNFRPQHWLVATGLMTSTVANCFAENDPHTTTTTPTNPPSNCNYSEGQFLFTTSWGESVYAHYYNNTLFAAYQDGSNFRPQHWLVATGLMTASVASCFAENDPHTTTPTTNPDPTTTNPPSNCGTGSGLTGFYANSPDLSQHLAAIRNDNQINFTWSDSPIPGIVNPDGFSIRWFGQVEAPVSGNYTFKTNNDDGSRVWVNGQLLINDWNGHGPTWQQGSIYLNAGKYTITIDFADFGGGAQAQLYWEYSGQSLQLIPSCRLYPIPSTSQVDSNIGNVRDYQLDGLIIRTDLSGKVYSSNLRSWPWPKNPTRCPNLSPKVPKMPNNQGAAEDDCGEGGNSGGETPGPFVPFPTYEPIPNDPSNPSNPGTGTGNTNPTIDPTITGSRVPTTARLDGVDCDKISGWAFANSGGYAYLDIYVDDVYGRFSKAATIKANNATREDVRKAYDNNPNIPLDCGFVWPIPYAYKHNQKLTIKVVPVNDVAPIGNSPLTTSGTCDKPVTTTPGGTQYPLSWKDFPNFKNLSDQYFLDNYILVGPKRPINIAERLKCFGTVPSDSKYQYSVTMYVDQPVNNTREIANFSISPTERRPGHTYFGLERYDSSTGQTVRLVAGFYVETEWKAAMGLVTQGAWGDDGATEYDISLKVALTASQFKAIKYKIEASGVPNYSLVQNNCSSFTYNLISPYINLPAGSGAIGILGVGINPADLGQDLRENANAYSGKITIADNAISPSSTNCN